MPYLSEFINEPFSESDNCSNSVSSVLHCALIALETGDFYTRWEAAKTISACGIEATQSGSPEEVINPLLNLLQEDSEEEVSWYIARILGTFGHPLAVQGLTHLLQTSCSVDVAGMAATALANCGAAAIPSLTDLLHQPEMKLLAIRALAQIEHPEVVPILLPLTLDSLPAVRSAAIDALSRFSSSAIQDALFAALQDFDSSVRRSAVGALGFQAQVLTGENNALMDAVIHALKPLLWDLDLEVCCQTALTLGRIGTADAVSELGKVLQSSNTPASLQQAIIRAIGWIGTPEAMACLQQALFNSAILNDESQIEIVTVLGRLKQVELCPTAVQNLLDLLHTQHPISQTSKGKQTIAHSLGQLAAISESNISANQHSNQKQSSEVITALIRLLEDSDAGVQLHVIAALKAFDQDAVNFELVRFSQDTAISANLRKGIGIALAERKRSIE
ncbi:HEAT repeat domain-containing protein [Leptolyngbya sp. GB1-A1]|uniref:HEAT repeat domain-containing protein n=1 Tax=unclassified Leptolyngbya TaxID=2650499 RepID=UPI00329699B2